MTDRLLGKKWDDLLHGVELTATTLRQQVRELFAADATRSCFSRFIGSTESREGYVRPTEVVMENLREV